MKTPKPERLEVTDFTLALLNAADERRPGFLLDCRDRATDQAFSDAAEHLGQLITKGEVEELDVRFRIAPHPIHGDSETVFKTMSFLASLDYIQQTYPRSHYYHFNREPFANAEEFHNGRHRPLPGSIDTYRRLTGRFLAIINHEPVEPLTS